MAFLWPQHRWVLPVLAALLLCPACRSRPAPGAGAKTPARTAAPDAGVPGKDPAATLRAFSLPHRVFTARLGSHRLVSTSTIKTRVSGSPERVVSQKLTLRVDKQGGYAATKTLGQQHGQQVIWTGGWLYPRLRHSKFTRRRARPDEAAAIADRLASHLPGYVDLLGPALTMTTAGQVQHDGRAALKVTLGLNPVAAVRANVKAASRRWRRSVKVTAIKGHAWLDARAGVPLVVKLTASWTFSAPVGSLPDSGIPAATRDGKRGTMELSYSQRLFGVGQVAPVQAPAADDTLNDALRLRLETERQMFSGELPIPTNWNRSAP